MPRKAKKKNDGQKPKTQQTDKTVNDEKVVDKNQADKNQEVVVKKKGKKRGRKPKPKSNIPKGPPKKRGRKPKGGKIIKKEDVENKIEEPKQQNIVLHLKCCSNDITEISNINKSCFQPYSIKDNNKLQSLNFLDIENKSYKKNSKITSSYDIDQNNGANIKEIYGKLNVLKDDLKRNNINDKRSSCFWCTYDFDNPTIYIPKRYNKGKIDVYGCFCSPECAVAFLKNENIDDATRWERYALLNNIYGKIYEYKKNIKPAPNPFYTLNKYYGNLTIQEYRKLMNNELVIMVIDKPITKIIHEIFETNNELPNVNNNLLYENNKPIRMLASKTIKSKKEILENTFSTV